MAKTANAIKHYEAALTAKDTQISGLQAANAGLQAKLNQVVELDTEDHTALAHAEARFGNLAPAAQPIEAPAVETPAEVPAETTA